MSSSESEKLRIRVAELLGWTEIESRELVHSPIPQLVGVKPGERPSQFTGYVPKYTLPNWPEKIEDAWELVEKLTQSHQVGVTFFGDCWQCELNDHRTDQYYPEIYGNADTAPEAICKAFVKVMETSNSLE